MPSFPRTPLLLRAAAALATVAAFAATILVPSTAPIASERLLAQPVAVELLPAAVLATTARATAAAASLGDPLLPMLLADDGIGDAAVAAASDAPRIAASDEDLVCLAKAVQHEAGGQAHDGRLAVAQLIVNRLRSGRFAATICGVVNQQGQFFHTASYNPDRDSAAWTAAVDVAREAVAGAAPNVAPGALFFHSAYQSPTGFFRNRQRVALLGGNVFYR